MRQTSNLVSSAGVGRIGGGVGARLLAREHPAEETRLLLRGAQFHIVGRRVTGKHVIAAAGLGVVLLVATEEAPALGAVGVSVCRGGTEALLALVVAGVQDLEED